jgi:hypothetical protein
MFIKSNLVSILLFFFSTNLLFAQEKFENYDKYKKIFSKENSKNIFLFRVDFENALFGLYSKDQLKQDFQNPLWSRGIDEGRATVVSDSSETRGKVLKVLYPAGGVDSKRSGACWLSKLPGQFEKMNIGYRVKFQKGFSFVKGGKLPGLSGGTESSGLRRSNGENGFSTRMMWYENGRVTSYVYHTNQAQSHGDQMNWTENNNIIYFKPDVWYSIEQQVTINTPGLRDGSIKGWIDGKLVFEKPGMNFRNTNKFAIDNFFFCTFFGGHTKDFESPRDQYAYFDDIIVSQEAIWNNSLK